MSIIIIIIYSLVIIKLAVQSLIPVGSLLSLYYFSLSLGFLKLSLIIPSS